MSARRDKVKTVAARALSGAVRSFDAMAKRQTKRVLMAESLLSLVVMAFVATPQAQAATFSTEQVFNNLNSIITNLLLPVGIAWASWQIVYIAVVCGLIGIDPLNLIGGNLDQDHIWAEIRNRFRNFGYGIAWVAGIWLLFEFVISLVSKLTVIISNNFS